MIFNKTITFMQTVQVKRLQDMYGRFKFIVPSRRITFYKIKDGERKEFNSPDIYNMSVWFCWKIKYLILRINRFTMFIKWRVNFVRFPTFI